MQHLELAIGVHPSAVEAAADVLRRFAPAGVSIEPPFESIDEDGSVQFPQAESVRLRAWLPAGASSERDVEELGAALGELGSNVVEPLTVTEVAEADWADAWKEHFQVTRVGERLVLRPSWREYEAEDGDIVVTVDPGRAFGTGQHETTRMCLIEMERLMTPGARVLDVGCGSGILSAAAALLGAASVDAIDIDPAAVNATKENARADLVAELIRVAEGSLGSAWPFQEQPADRYDIVLANVSSRVVQDLAGDILAALNATGVALVSGIIGEQEERCVEALVQAGATSFARRADGDWRLLAVTR